MPLALLEARAVLAPLRGHGRPGAQRQAQAAGAEPSKGLEDLGLAPLAVQELRLLFQPAHTSLPQPERRAELLRHAALHGRGGQLAAPGLHLLVLLPPVAEDARQGLVPRDVPELAPRPEAPPQPSLQVPDEELLQLRLARLAQRRGLALLLLPLADTKLHPSPEWGPKHDLCVSAQCCKHPCLARFALLHLLPALDQLLLPGGKEHGRQGLAVAAELGNDLRFPALAPSLFSLPGSVLAPRSERQAQPGAGVRRQRRQDLGLARLARGRGLALPLLPGPGDLLLPGDDRHAHRTLRFRTQGCQHSRLALLSCLKLLFARRDVALPTGKQKPSQLLVVAGEPGDNLGLAAGTALLLSAVTAELPPCTDSKPQVHGRVLCQGAQDLRLPLLQRLHLQLPRSRVSLPSPPQQGELPFSIRRERREDLCLPALDLLALPLASQGILLPCL
mmetsp:Transcript_112607/g.329107  ORF Transcript_112607/g.329107 Transcript_112607/m.329107 type:complete len:447 (-) Transcript_112607:915-2255(-)